MKNQAIMTLLITSFFTTTSAFGKIRNISDSFERENITVLIKADDTMEDKEALTKRLASLEEQRTQERATSSDLLMKYFTTLRKDHPNGIISSRLLEPGQHDDLIESIDKMRDLRKEIEKTKERLAQFKIRGN